MNLLQNIKTKKVLYCSVGSTNVFDFSLKKQKKLHITACLRTVNGLQSDITNEPHKYEYSI